VSCAAIRAIADCNNRRALAQTSGPERLTRGAVLTIMTIFPGVLRLALRGTFPDVATYELGNSYCAECLNKDPIAKLAESTAERAQTQISCSETGYQQNLLRSRRIFGSALRKRP
jgi:hypothetical protein